MSEAFSPNVHSPIFTESDASQFDHLVRSRKSTRGFLPDRVPDDLLQKIFETARWSPSGTNVQPWHICVASGAVRDTIRTGFLARADNKIASKPDHASDSKLGDLWRERKRGCARALYGAMGIEWEDRAGRGRAGRRNHEFFDAPHVAFLGIHSQFGPQTVGDIGMFAQTLMLAMTVNGVASCAQGSLRDHPDLVREAFGLPPEVKILFGISFGFEDPTVSANQARTDRAPLSETVSFLG